MLNSILPQILDSLHDIWTKIYTDPWVIIGFIGQAVFMSRMVVQWVASEREKKSVIPIAFWYLSLVGSLILLIYAIYKEDPVFILGQLFGFVVYIRNLVLIAGHKKRENAAA